MLSHHHHHHASGNLKLAFFLNLFFTIVEIFGGIFTNSVAILSDAIHDLGDSISLGFAWWAQNKSTQKRTSHFTFGYGRWSLLGALTNSIILIGGALVIIYEAINRFFDPVMPHAEGMLYLAILGILFNGYAAWKTSTGVSLNEKVVSWHLLEDVLGWVTVLIAAIILQFYTLPWIDPLLSIVINLWIMWNVVKRLKETLNLFLQGVPEGVDVEEISKTLSTIDGVTSIHNTQIWSVEGEHHVFSAHLRLTAACTVNDMIRIKTEARSKLKKYPFLYSTIETELSDNDCSDTEDSNA
jgi:cobalt-zinc-cadmium efflux system protein